jgi:hypothetical protein
VYINNQYERQGDVVLKKLFATKDLTDAVRGKQSAIKKELTALRQVLGGGEPEIGIGLHCSNPHACDFHGYCWKDVPEDSVFDVAGLWLSKKFELYGQGVVRMQDIPAGYDLNEAQKIQLDGVRENKKRIEAKAINRFVKNIRWPVHFLDFETFNPAVPLYDGTRPYQKITFQYSLHIQNEPGGDCRHCEFLAAAGPDPRKQFIERLLADTESSGDILVYNQVFEIGCLNDLAEIFPESAAKITNLIARVKDLMAPFRKKHYYTPEMRGSYSIKAVYPALAPGKSYDDLVIQDGGIASSSFNGLLSETDPVKIAATRKALLEYCKRDTQAMVEIFAVLALLAPLAVEAPPPQRFAGDGKKRQDMD